MGFISTGSNVEKLLSKTSENSTELVVEQRDKLISVINNAKAIQKLKGEKAIPSLKEYLWSFVDNRPILNQWKLFKEITSKTDESERMNKAFKFEG